MFVKSCNLKNPDVSLFDKTVEGVVITSERDIVQKTSFALRRNTLVEPGALGLGAPHYNSQSTKERIIIMDKYRLYYKLYSL